MKSWWSLFPIPTCPCKRMNWWHHYHPSSSSPPHPYSRPKNAATDVGIVNNVHRFPNMGVGLLCTVHLSVLKADVVAKIKDTLLLPA